MKRNNFIKLIISVIVAELAGVIGSIFTSSSVSTWYRTLPKPAFNPPNWVFSPVWIALFLLMGIAAFLIWKKGWKHKGVRVALFVYAIQLVLNIFWSIIFFGWRSPAAAFSEILLLWLAILLTIILFSRLSRAAAWLLVPYILWVTFAAVLNFSIWSISFRIRQGTLIYLPAHSTVYVANPALRWGQR